MANTLSPTIAAPPTTVDVTSEALASMAVLSGVVTDYNAGSQIRTTTESMGAVVEQQGISAQALALQALVYSALGVFGIMPGVAKQATGDAITFTTALTSPPPAPQPIAIPQGTLVGTAGGILFVTANATILNQGSTSVSVPIIAVNGGSNGNVPSLSINQLIGSLTYPLRVFNASQTTGGADAESPSQSIGQLNAIVASLVGGSPVSIANAPIGVNVSGEIVKYATCFDNQTEVLSNKGWFKFSELPQDVLIATLNPTTHVLEYKPIRQRQKFAYDGNLVHLQNRFIDLAVTPDHRVYVKARGEKKWSFRAADQVVKNNQFKRNCEWHGEEVAIHKVGGYLVPMDLWLEFLGYYIAEGCATITKLSIKNKHRNPNAKFRWKKGLKETLTAYSYRVQIAQHKSESKAKMKACFDQLPFKAHETKAGFSIACRALTEELSPLGKSHQKHIPAYAKTLSSRQISILLNALIEGDGYDGRKNLSRHKEILYSTSSKVLANDVQELALKAGLASNLKIDNKVGQLVVIKGRGVTGKINHPHHIVSIHSEHFETTLTQNPKEIGYKGDVYCLTVDNHIIYVRRNGKSCWVGQCYEGWLAAGSGAGSGIAGYTVYIDNGSGGASTNLINAVIAKLNGNAALGQRGYRDAGVPYAVDAVIPVGSVVNVEAAVNTFGNWDTVSGSIGNAITAYYDTLNFGISAEQAQIAAAAADAGAGVLSSLSVSLAYLTASGTAVTAVSGQGFNRVILSSLLLASGSP